MSTECGSTYWRVPLEDRHGGESQDTRQRLHDLSKTHGMRAACAEEQRSRAPFAKAQRVFEAAFATESNVTVDYAELAVIANV